MNTFVTVSNDPGLTSDPFTENILLDAIKRQIVSLTKMYEEASAGSIWSKGSRHFVSS